MAPREPTPPLRRRSRRDEAPPAPWGKFPLVELCVLLSLILIGVGLFSGGRRGFTILAGGLGLGSLAALELVIREHLAGYKSHSTLISAVLAVAAGAIMFFARLPQVIFLPVAAAVFATGFWALRQLFKRRSGGMSFR